MTAQQIRAILLANATAVTKSGFRPRSWASHGSPPMRREPKIVETAPMTSTRRMCPLPRFETWPSFVRPPVERCLGVRPSQAAKARLDAKVGRAKLAETVQALAARTIAMEACASSHHWGRLFISAGCDVRLINPRFVKPFVKGSNRMPGRWTASQHASASAATRDAR
jgi:hypothetical protein